MDYGIPDYSRSTAPQQSAPVVEDLIEGLDEWRNIQDIVRITFKAFHDVLKAQGEAIKTLERALDSKAGRAEVAAALQQKASTFEVSQRLREVEGQLSAKADVADVERRALKTELDAALKVHMSDMYAVVSTKADDAETRVWKDQAERSTQQLRGELLQVGTSMREVASHLDAKANAADVTAALSEKADALEVDEALRDKVGRKAMSEALARKADKMELDRVDGQVMQLVEVASRKADAGFVDQLHTRLDNTAATTSQLQSRLDASVAATANDLQVLRKSLDATARDMKSAVDQQAGQISDIQKIATGIQADLQEQDVHRCEAISRKADSAEVRDALATKADVSQVNEALSAKANATTVHTILDNVEGLMAMGKQLELLQQDVKNRPNAADVCALVDGKASIDDVNRALLQMCQELESKAGAEDLRKSVKDQSIINNSLCADLTVARWLWKSGKTKTGNAVPWNVQTLNSDPENFIWEKDKATILTAVPGLYEITFGFYSKKKPSVQLLVNGEPVLSAVNNSSYVVHHSSGRLAPVSNHPAGNITGLTCIDFLSLPSKAKLVLTFQGEEKGEGFFCLKKL